MVCHGPEHALHDRAPDDGAVRRRWSTHRHRSVSLIELVYIAEKRSDSIDAETLRELLASIQASDSPIAIAPMTIDVARHMVSVNRAQVRDPFDRAIVATAQTMGLPLLTRDSTLTRHFPKLCVW